MGERGEGFLAAMFGSKKSKAAALAAGIMMSHGEAARELASQEPGIVEVGSEEEPIASARSGDWNIEARAVGDVLVHGRHGKTVYHFLKGTLATRDWFAPLPDADQQAVIDGYISLVRSLNPGVNIDSFASVDGTALKFPLEADIVSQPAVEVSALSGGYSRVQELAVADGFELGDSAQWQRMYDSALRDTTVEVPSSTLYLLDREGSEDSPARLEPDVLARLERLAADFVSRTFGGRAGWRFSLTDMLRSPAIQRLRHHGEKKPVLATTHYTGRSTDISDGRFLDPNGNVVTWSRFDENGKGVGPGEFADLIDSEIRPALLELAMEHGFYPYSERGHWHVYAPKDRHADLRDLLVVEPVAKRMPSAKKADSPERKIAQVVPESKLDRELLSVLKSIVKRDVDSPEETAARFAVIDPLIDLAYFVDPSKPMKRKVGVYLDVMTSFKPLLPKDKRYARMDLEDVGNELRPIIMQTAKDSKAPRLEARRILQGRLQQEMVEAVSHMSSDEILERRVMVGMTVHSRKKYPFHDLRGVWNFKMTDKDTTSPEVLRYAPSTLRQLEGKNRSVSMEEWVDRQAAAGALFARHVDEFVNKSSNEASEPAFGESAEMLSYVTPDVMFAIVHAEFFSELDPEAYVAFAPILFELYNIAYGPAVHDKKYSGGLVQMTAGTFGENVRKYGDTLRKIRASDPEARFIVPTHVRGNQFDLEEFSAAMLTDLDSQLFYNSFVVAVNTRPAIRSLKKDGRFQAAWNAASDADRKLYMAALVPAAINNPKAASRGAVRSFQAYPMSLRDMAAHLHEHIGLWTAARGAERGYGTMSHLLVLTEKE